MFKVPLHFKIMAVYKSFFIVMWSEFDEISVGPIGTIVQ